MQPQFSAFHEILNRYKEFTVGQRIELMIALFQLSLPIELKFFNTYIQYLSKISTSPFLEKLEVVANKSKEIEKINFDSPNIVGAVSQLITVISLLHLENIESALKFSAKLKELKKKITNTKLNFNSNLKGDLSLLFLLSNFHPSIQFECKLKSHPSFLASLNSKTSPTLNSFPTSTQNEVKSLKSSNSFSREPSIPYHILSSPRSNITTREKSHSPLVFNSNTRRVSIETKSTSTTNSTSRPISELLHQVRNNSGGLEAGPPHSRVFQPHSKHPSPPNFNIVNTVSKANHITIATNNLPKTSGLNSQLPTTSPLCFFSSNNIHCDKNDSNNSHSSSPHPTVRTLPHSASFSENPYSNRYKTPSNTPLPSETHQHVTNGNNNNNLKSSNDKNKHYFSSSLNSSIPAVNNFSVNNIYLQRPHSVQAIPNLSSHYPSFQKTSPLQTVNPLILSHPYNSNFYFSNVFYSKLPNNLSPATFNNNFIYQNNSQCLSSIFLYNPKVPPPSLPIKAFINDKKTLNLHDLDEKNSFLKSNDIKFKKCENKLLVCSNCAEFGHRIDDCPMPYMIFNEARSHSQMN